jgi:Leucine-rich repeat (LRR) protein
MLEILDLNKNRIQKISEQAFVGLRKLKELYLQHNQITKLNDGILKPLENLEEISLYNNLIDLVESSSFRNNKKLQIIHLGKNKIVVVDPMIFKNIPSLETLNMKENICAESDFTGITAALSICMKIYERLESKKLLNALKDGIRDQKICEECSTPECDHESQLGSTKDSSIFISVIIFFIIDIVITLYIVISFINILKKYKLN